jgi:hypothetical protein
MQLEQQEAGGVGGMCQELSQAQAASQRASQSGVM